MSEVNDFIDVYKPMMTQLAAGNPGAATVLCMLAERPRADLPAGHLDLFLDMERLGLRGSQIWVAFKDHCKKDIITFARRVRDGDAALLQEREGGILRSALKEAAAAGGANVFGIGPATDEEIGRLIDGFGEPGGGQP
jgi:hypothetical protein